MPASSHIVFFTIPCAFAQHASHSDHLRDGISVFSTIRCFSPSLKTLMEVGEEAAAMVAPGATQRPYEQVENLYFERFEAAHKLVHHLQNNKALPKRSTALP